MKILFVLHHFTNPLWFEEKKGWEDSENLPAFINYSEQCLEHFGDLVWSWNTFNEPNVYAFNAYLNGQFPPFKKSPLLMRKVMRHMGEAPYYAYIPFTPGMITEIDQPGELAKRGIPHDKMWGYRPEGLYRNVLRFWKKYKKPILITENGVCSDSAEVRIQAIKDYLSLLHKAIGEGVEMLGYIHWSTWDNFEWHLGPTYRFGLMQIDLETKERIPTAAAAYYSKVCAANKIILEE